MKTLFFSTIVAVVAASAVNAEVVRARITYVEPRYETVYQNNPTTQCYDVEVPVYGNTGGGANGGDVLSGMIIGGLLGKGATGNDRGAAVGAILGGVIAGDNNNGRQVITGYRIERQCKQVNSRSQTQQLKNYFIRFEWNGLSGTAYTYNNYRVGDGIDANANLNAN